MKFEITFNQVTYNNQLDLLCDLAWKKKIAYYKNSYYLGFTLIFIGFLVSIDKLNLLSFLFIIFGLSIIVPYYYYYFKIKSTYARFKIEKNNASKANKEVTILEFSEKSFTFQDSNNKTELDWNDFIICFVKENNLFMITNNHIPFILAEVEIGNENFKNISTFVESKIVKKNTKSRFK